MKLEVIKDVIGQPYLVVKYSIENRNYTQIFNLIRKLKYYINDDDNFLNIVNNHTKRDGLCQWHITLFNAIECKQYPELLKLEGFEVNDVNLLGVGTISKDNNHTYYIVCESKELIDLYKSKINKNKYLHITIGFTNKDIFNKPKDVSTLLFDKNIIFEQEKFNDDNNTKLKYLHLSNEELKTYLNNI